MTHKSLRIVHFRPWPWSPVFKIEYNTKLVSVEEVLSIVKSQTRSHLVLEPMALYMADLLAKQTQSVIKFYGDINSRHYPQLFSAYRTSKR